MPDKIKRQFELKSYNNNRPFLADLTALKSTVKIPVLLFVHGFKGFKDWGHFDYIANHCANEGFAFIKFNMAFNGTTIANPHGFNDLTAFSQNNFSKELNDIKRMIDFITSQPFKELSFDLEKLYLIGHSRGGGVSIIKASEDDRIKGLVTWAALNNFKMGFNDELIEIWEKKEVIHVENARTNQQMPIHIQAYHDLQDNSKRLDPKYAITQLNKPVLLIHGDKDETVPLAHALELKELNPEAHLHIVKDGNHVFGGTHPFEGDELHPHAYEVINKTVSFFKNL